jgi:hypothetical protein
MTTHLRETEFVDFAEGTLDAPRTAHLEACAACRAEAEGIAVALREAAAVEMPEPSPLFWEHFSARVHDQVTHEVPERAPSWTTVAIRVLMPLAAAVAVVIGIVSATLLPRLMQGTPSDAALGTNQTSAKAASAAPVPSAVGSDLDTTNVDAKNAEVWDMLTAAASDMSADDAHAAGMGMRPGAVDHAVQHMNQTELTELGRLLKTELKRSSD